MKALVFDTGPLISLSLNNLLWILPKLKEKFDGSFYITENVRREAVDKPLRSKKFKLEALQIMHLIKTGTIELFDHPDLLEKSKELHQLSNQIFKVNGNYVKTVQFAEIEAVVAAILAGAQGVVIDEFITRGIIEGTKSLHERMERRLHNRVKIDYGMLETFQKQVESIKVLRSMELVIVAYESGFFEHFMMDIDDARKTLLEALLWGVKLNGCSLSGKEIDEVLRLELH